MKRKLMFPPPITPDEVVQAALSAYYAEVASCTPPLGAPDPTTWASPSDFADGLIEGVRRRLARRMFGPLVDEPAFPGMALRLPGESS